MSRLVHSSPRIGVQNAPGLGDHPVYAPLSEKSILAAPGSRGGPFAEQSCQHHALQPYVVSGVAAARDACHSGRGLQGR
jgi:hypothetical protein